MAAFTQPKDLSVPEETFRGATRRPPRPTSPVASRTAPVDDLPYQPPTTMAEVEERIYQTGDDLLELKDDDRRLSEAAAEAEADWESHLSTIIVQLHDSGEKTAADIREAIARVTLDENTGLTGNQLYRRYKVTKATAASTGRALRTVGAILDSYRTVAANVRSSS